MTNQYTVSPEKRNEMAVLLPEAAELGPAMRALPTDRMRAFVVAMHENALRGDDTQGSAAKSAGFSGDMASLRVTGYRLAHDERIQEAMKEEGHRRLGALVPLATGRLAEILRGAAAKDAMRAITAVLNRTGMPERSDHTVTVRHEKSEADKIQQALELAKMLGIDITAALGEAAPKDVGPVLDAEFVVVENHSQERDPWDPEERP